MFSNEVPDWVDRRGGGDEEDGVLHPLPLTALDPEHLLKVAGAITQEAQEVLGGIWAQLDGRVTADGYVAPELRRGFEPGCGWTEFMGKLWLLKHHLDSASRVCRH